MGTKFPQVHTFAGWRMDLFKAVQAASRKPPTGEIFEWHEYSEGKSVDFASLAVSGTRHARLDARLAAALS